MDEMRNYGDDMQCRMLRMAPEIEFTADNISRNETGQGTDTSQTENINNTANINISHDAGNGTPIWDRGTPPPKKKK